MIIGRQMVKVKATAKAWLVRARYGGRSSQLNESEALEYIYAVTGNVVWDHWKPGVSADNTDVKSIIRRALRYPSGSVFIEIGSWMGRTTCALGMALKIKGGGKVLAVDNFAGDVKHVSQHKFVNRCFGGDYFGIFWRNIEKHKLSGIVVPVRKLSREALSEVKEKLGGCKCQLLFIDGDHTEEGVRDDIRQYVPLVAEGGAVIFDDFNSDPVRHAAEEMNKYGLWERQEYGGGKMCVFVRLH